MKRLFVLVMLCGLILQLCGCKEVDGQSTQTPAGDTITYESPGVKLPIKPYASVDLPVDYSQYNNVYAKNIVPCREDIDVVIPVTSILPGKSLEVLVNIDDQVIHVAAAVDSVGNYVVWYGVCQECIETGTSTHPQIVYEGESAILCNGCGKVFKMSDLARGNSSDSDRCAPYIIEPGRYEVKRVSECTLQLDAFPWLNASLEEDPNWLTPQVSLSDIANDNCIAIPYSTMHEDCELFLNWYYAASGQERPSAEE